MPDLIVHLGLPKTGTTSLQMALDTSEHRYLSRRRLGEIRKDNVSLQALQAVDIFISDETVLFRSLVPQRENNGQIHLFQSWRHALKLFLADVQQIFPNHQLQIAISPRNLEEWLISAYTQKFDSNYFIDKIEFTDFRHCLMKEAAEVCDFLKSPWNSILTKWISEYGRTMIISSDELRDYLKAKGFCFTQNQIATNKHNRRSNHTNAGKSTRYWQSKPITLGQFIAKLLMPVTPSSMIEKLKMICQCQLLSSLSCFYFTFDSNGRARLKIALTSLPKRLDGQAVGKIYWA